MFVRTNSNKRTTWKHIMVRFISRAIAALIKAAVGAVLILFCALLMAEWMLGCGETYTDAHGVVHVNNCLITKSKE